MKIAFLTSTSAPTPYREYYSIIINYLIRKGYNVSHTLLITQELIDGLDKERRENIFFNFYKDIKESDLVIAECSIPSTNIGYEISHALQNEKEVIILKSTEENIKSSSDDFLYYDKKVTIYEYNKNNLLSTLKEALEFNTPPKYKKFNVLFTPNMVAKLNLVSKKKNLPKSVYIRELIEKSLILEEL